MTWRGVWEGEAGLSRLRLVPEGFNGPETPIDVLDWVAEELRGQCVHSLLDVLERVELPELEGDQDFTTALDGEVFLCDQCGWWCEVCEESKSSSGCCTDCQPDDDY
jgi:hypothetical protein